MFSNKLHEIEIICELVEYMIDHEHYLFFKLGEFRVGKHFRIRCLEDLIGLMGDQMIANIILVFKIQIKSSFCHTCAIYNVGDGSLIKSIIYKQRKADSRRESLFCCLLLSTFPMKIKILSERCVSAKRFVNQF